MEAILEYLKCTYSPVGIIVYGSFADGTKSENSDFDVLVITYGGSVTHDSSVVNGIVLDAFIYPRDAVRAEDFLHIYGGRIVLDMDGTVSKLMDEVTENVNNFTPKTYEENCKNVKWCEKMLLRVQRSDAEGYFRWHWLLTDSLEIYSDIVKNRYLGPKKSLMRMRSEDEESYYAYEKALANLDYSSLSAWIYRLKELMGNI